MLNGWNVSDSVRDALVTQEADELQRSIAGALIATAQQAAHTSSITTINSILLNSEVGKTPEGEHELHVRVVQEERRVADLIHLMRDVDNTLINLCVSLNDLAAVTDDAILVEKIKILRSGVLATGDLIRSNIELNIDEE